MSKNYKVILAQFPSRVEPNANFEGRVVLLNTGDETWVPRDPNGQNNGENGFRLGSDNPEENLTWGPNKRFDLSAPVPQGGIATFDLNLTAPATVGYREIDWRMLQEQVTWFANAPRIWNGIQVGTALAYSKCAVPDYNANDPSAIYQAYTHEGSPVAMSMNSRTIRWVNHTGRKMAILGAYVWSGVEQYKLCDNHCELVRVSDQSTLAVVQWDRYAEPTAPNNSVWVNFDYGMTLDVDDALDLFWYGSNPAGNSHHRAMIRFTYE